jgi:hypothetical protein
MEVIVSLTYRPLTPVEGAPGTHWVGGWMDQRAGMNVVPCWESNPGRPARSPSVYRRQLNLEGQIDGGRSKVKVKLSL